MTLPEVIWAHIDKEAERVGSTAQAITVALIEHYGYEEMQVSTTVQNGYAGFRREDGSKVVVSVCNGKQTLLENTCGRDWNWGYGGGGPSQLAGSILTHYFQDEEKADIFRQRFKWDYAARFEDEWEISNEEIRLWLDKQIEQI